MFKEVFFLLTLPLILFFTGFTFLPKFKSFNTLGFLEKLVITLAVSTSLLVTTFILVGISPLSFRLFAKILYWANFGGLILLLVLQRKKIRVYFLNVLKAIKKSFSGNLFDLFFISLLCVFIFKITLFLLLKPIVDADVINFYLPIARTIFLEDKIPPHSFYNTMPIFFPPPGISTLYAFSYSVVNSLFSESFRLIPLPFILGTVGVLYLIARKFFDKKIAQFATVIFLFLPFWDEFGMAGIFYPDIMFLFLSAVVFYLFLKIFEKNYSKNSYFWGTILGIILGSIALFKFQGLALYYFLFLFGLRSLTVLHQKIKYVLPILAISPFLIDVSKFGIGYFRYPSPFIKFFLMPIFLIFLFLFFGAKKRFKNFQELKLSLYIFLVSLPFGAIWFVRNFLVFGNPYFLVTPEGIFTWKIMGKIFEKTLLQPGGVEWTILLVPSLASFWLIPKIIFFLKSFFDKRLALLSVWIISWYMIWLYYLDGTNSRHLIPIFPLISLMTIYGIVWIGSKIFDRRRVYLFSLIAVILGSLASLSQSLFLWWNWGITIYGSEILHRIVEQETLGQKRNFFFPLLASLPNKILTLLNSQGEIFLKRIPALGILSFILSLFILLVAIKGVRYAQFLGRFKKEAVLGVCLVLFLPYIFTFYTIADGNLSQFGQKEKEKVYNYWGLTETVIPYLINNASGGDMVAYFGTPQVGLSYFTNLKVYNLLGEDLGWVFKPIFYESDLEKIYLFFRERNINYFVVGQNNESKSALEEFKGLTKIPQILENKEYFEQEIFPSKETQWALYKIKK